MNTKQRYQLLGLFMLTAILLLSIFFIRNMEGNPTLYGGESYFNLRLLQEPIGYDSVQDRPMLVNIYWVGLSFIPQHLHVLLAHALPVLFGLLSFILLTLIIRERPDRSLILLLTISNPIYIFLFTTFSVFNVAVPLFLGGFLVFRKKHGWLSFPFFMLTMLIDSLFAIASLLVLLAYTVRNPYQWRWFYIVLVASLAALAYLITFNTIDILAGFQPRAVTLIFAEFGAFPGLAIALLVLGVIGCFASFKQNNTKLTALVLLILLVVLASQSFVFLILLALFMPFLATSSITYFVERKWTLNILKSITLLLIFCSLLFPLLTFHVDAISKKPVEESLVAFKLLQSYTMPNQKVFSSEENGYLIEYFARTPVFLDDASRNYPLYPRKKVDEHIILNSRQLENTTTLLDKNKLSLFFIDKDMRVALWNDKDQGLMFLLKTSSLFEEVWNVDGVQIFVYDKGSYE